MRTTNSEGMAKKWIGVRNVVDQESSDLWANLVGWYTADINGEELQFSFLANLIFYTNYNYTNYM